jgi:hypothetical protein
MRQPLWKFVRNYGLLILWLAAALLLYSWHQSDHQIEQSIINLPRERNYDAPYRMTDLKLVLLTFAVMTAEIIILYLILRPWSYPRSIGRLLLASALFMVLLILSSMTVFGASNYVVFYRLWLLVVSSILVAYSIILGISIAAEKGRMKTS